MEIYVSLWPVGRARALTRPIKTRRNGSLIERARAAATHTVLVCAPGERHCVSRARRQQPIRSPAWRRRTRAGSAQFAQLCANLLSRERVRVLLFVVVVAVDGGFVVVAQLVTVATLARVR